MEHTPQTATWQFDRRLSVSALVTGLSSLVMVVALITALNTRVEHLEKKTIALDSEVMNIRAIAIGMARMEERLDALHRTLEELRGEVRHLYRQPSPPGNLSGPAESNARGALPGQGLHTMPHDRGQP